MADSIRNHTYEADETSPVSLSALLAEEEEDRATAFYNTTLNEPQGHLALLADSVLAMPYMPSRHVNNEFHPSSCEQLLSNHDESSIRYTESKFRDSSGGSDNNESPRHLSSSFGGVGHLNLKEDNIMSEEKTSAGDLDLDGSSNPASTIDSDTKGGEGEGRRTGEVGAVESLSGHEEVKLDQPNSEMPLSLPVDGASSSRQINGSADMSAEEELKQLQEAARQRAAALELQEAADGTARQTRKRRRQVSRLFYRPPPFYTKDEIEKLSVLLLVMRHRESSQADGKQDSAEGHGDCCNASICVLVGNTLEHVANCNLNENQRCPKFQYCGLVKKAKGHQCHSKLQGWAAFPHECTICSHIPGLEAEYGQDLSRLSLLLPTHSSSSSNLMAMAGAVPTSVASENGMHQRRYLNPSSSSATLSSSPAATPLSGPSSTPSSSGLVPIAAAQMMGYTFGGSSAQGGATMASVPCTNSVAMPIPAGPLFQSYLTSQHILQQTHPQQQLAQMWYPMFVPPTPAPFMAPYPTTFVPVLPPSAPPITSTPRITVSASQQQSQALSEFSNSQVLPAEGGSTQSSITTTNTSPRPPATYNVEQVEARMASLRASMIASGSLSVPAGANYSPQGGTQNIPGGSSASAPMHLSPAVSNTTRINSTGASIMVSGSTTGGVRDRGANPGIIGAGSSAALSRNQLATAAPVQNNSQQQPNASLVPSRAVNSSSRGAPRVGGMIDIYHQDVINFYRNGGVFGQQQQAAEATLQQPGYSASGAGVQQYVAASSRGRGRKDEETR